MTGEEFEARMYRCNNNNNNNINRGDGLGNEGAHIQADESQGVYSFWTIETTPSNKLHFVFFIENQTWPSFRYIGCTELKYQSRSRLGRLLVSR